MSELRCLTVHLGDTLVGRLWRNGSNSYSFRLSQDYVQMAHRPVLGQRFEDMNQRGWNYSGQLPPWFGNLLPEGLLRQLLTRATGQAQLDDFNLLAELGQDVPGAAVIREVSIVDEGSGVVEPPVEETPLQVSGPFIKFSLAGVQMKFSMQAGADRSLVLSGQGSGATWIVKTPDATFGHVCENEFAVMTWARLAGLDVPETRLVDVDRLVGLPANLPRHAEKAYAIRRFDRTESGRVHQEDLAQVCGMYATQKYDRHSFESVGRLIVKLCGEKDLHEFLRRLVFIVACGNGDSHLKNWTLRYPDRIHPALSPAYDLVATVVYPGYEADDLALPLQKSRRFQDVSLHSWQSMAKHVELPETQLVQWVRAAVEQTTETWHQLCRDVLPDLELPEGFRHRLERHMAGVPLLLGRGAA